MPIMRHLAVLAMPFALMFSSNTSWAGDAATGPSTVVASQGGVVVTLDDIDAFAKSIPEGQRAGFFGKPQRIENTVTNLLLQKQLAAEARKLGLDKESIAQVQLRLAEDEALAKLRMQRLRESMKMPDFNQLAKEDYIANKKSYITRGALTVKHILVDTKERSDAEALTLAKKIETDVRAHPDQFDALVEKYSEDPSKESNHGRMDDAGDASKYVPEFAEASAKLTKPGEISPIVKTKYGYHIIKLIERTADKPRTFEQMQYEIVNRLRNEYTEKQLRNHVDTLRNLPMDANADLVASLRERYDRPSTTTPAQPK